MERIPTDSPEHPVFYAGRFSEEVAGAGLPGDHTVLSDWDVLPPQLSSALERASVLVVLDMFSFPFESLTGDLAGRAPDPAPPGGSGCRLPRDRVRQGQPSRGSASSTASRPLTRSVWAGLRRRYDWTGGQRVEIEDGRPEHAAAEIVGRAGGGVRASRHFRGGRLRGGQVLVRARRCPGRQRAAPRDLQRQPRPEVQQGHTQGPGEGAPSPVRSGPRDPGRRGPLRRPRGRRRGRTLGRELRPG